MIMQVLTLLNVDVGVILVLFGGLPTTVAKQQKQNGGSQTHSNKNPSEMSKTD